MPNHLYAVDANRHPPQGASTATNNQVMKALGSDVVNWVTIGGDVSGGPDNLSVTDLTIGSQATGDLIYFNGTNWVRRAATTNGFVLSLSGGVPVWVAGSAIAAPGGSPPQIQYNNSGAFGGVGNVSFNTDNFQLKDDAAPVAPASTGVVSYSKGGVRSMIASLGLGDPGYALQPGLFERGVKYWAPHSGGTLTSFGCAIPGIIGSAQTNALADTNLLTTILMTSSFSTGAANVGAGFYGQLGLVLAGSTGRGGYTYKARFGIVQASTDGRLFAGLRNTTAVPTATIDPSAYTGALLGFYFDDANADMGVIHNDAAGAAVTATLGANFPKTAGALYDIEIRVPKDGTKDVTWKVTRLDAAFEASGTWSTDIPAAGALMAPTIYMNTGGGTVVVEPGLAFMYLEPGL